MSTNSSKFSLPRRWRLIPLSWLGGGAGNVVFWTRVTVTKYVWLPETLPGVSLWSVHFSSCVILWSKVQIVRMQKENKRGKKRRQRTICLRDAHVSVRIVPRSTAVMTEGRMAAISGGGGRGGGRGAGLRADRIPGRGCLCCWHGPTSWPEWCYHGCPVYDSLNFTFCSGASCHQLVRTDG